MSDAFRDESALQERLQRAEDEAKELREKLSRRRTPSSPYRLVAIVVIVLAGIAGTFGYISITNTWQGRYQALRGEADTCSDGFVRYKAIAKLDDEKVAACQTESVACEKQLGDEIDRVTRAYAGGGAAADRFYCGTCDPKVETSCPPCPSEQFDQEATRAGLIKTAKERHIDSCKPTTHTTPVQADITFDGPTGRVRTVQLFNESEYTSDEARCVRRVLHIDRKPFIGKGATITLTFEPPKPAKPAATH